MNLRDAAHIVDTSAASTVPREAPLPRRRTAGMILAEIESTIARTHALLRELRGRLPNE